MHLMNHWENGTADDVFREFDGVRWDGYRNDDDPVPVDEKPAFKDVDILLASYSLEGYDGNAFVLFRRDGKLWEVNAWHCSCFGLEGQWEPEETTTDALRHRVKEGELGKGNYGNYGDGGGAFGDQLLQVLDGLEKS